MGYQVLIGEGVISDQDMLSFIPFNEDALQRHSPLEVWIKDGLVRTSVWKINFAKDMTWKEATSITNVFGIIVKYKEELFGLHLLQLLM